MSDERTVPDEETEITDFSVNRKAKVFRLEDDVFHAYPVIPIPTMQTMMQAARDMGKIVGESTDNKTIEHVTEQLARMFDGLLPEDEAHRMRERLATRDGYVAVDLRQQVMPVINWLMERYGLRPTEPSPDSSAGSPSGGTGTDSTAGVPLEASTQLL